MAIAKPFNRSTAAPSSSSLSKHSTGVSGVGDRYGTDRSDANRSFGAPRGPKLNGTANNSSKPDRVEHPILFQKFFKSVGPRTYAVQMKRATNGNHYLVLTEGRRDEKTGEVWKKRLNVFSEDFEAFHSLIRDVSLFNTANPVPEKVRRQQAARWKNGGASNRRSVAPLSKS